jgi:hypothetical protein
LSRYRVGPWPGLTPRGAAILLACAVFLAIGQVMVGPPGSPLPDLPVLGVTALLPLVVGARILRTPGSASAIAGVYLLPASLVSLLMPSIQPPPLLLVPAVAFDVGLWLQPAHLVALAGLWPGRASPGRRHRVPALQLTRLRAVAAGAVFGLVLALIEPPFRLFLGAQPAVWSAPELWLATVVTTAACAALGTLLTARGTAA